MILKTTCTQKLSEERQGGRLMQPAPHREAQPLFRLPLRVVTLAAPQGAAVLHHVNVRLLG